MLVGSVGGLPIAGEALGSSFAVWLGPATALPAFVPGAAAGLGAVPVCKIAGMALPPVPGAAAGAFGPPGCGMTLRTTFFGSAGVPLGLTAGGASTSVPSGLLITLLTTFFIPGAALLGEAPGVAVGADPLVGAPGGAALIPVVVWYFCSVGELVFEDPSI